MSRRSKLLKAILDGHSDGNIRFVDLCATLDHLGFGGHVRGSHHLYQHPTVPELINLQAVAGKAKRYQVRQVRRILIEHGLTSLPGDHREK